MLIKHLIKDTIWTPSKKYAIHKPQISVFLPTYSRAKSGLFSQAVNSIINQTFTNFELIFIDDASTDGTKDLIQQFMAQDDRISCLTHPQNIGLPAVSEYEAFMKSTGTYIIFAFDDFIFEPNAFEVLYYGITETSHDFCHGLAKLYYHEESDIKYLLFGENSASYQINSTNTIANSSVIVKKDIFYKIGLYDPHILMVRICDWDLWIRISKSYHMKKIDVIIGSEYGCVTQDSLGALYNNNTIAARKYMARNRNPQLLPQNFAEFNVTQSISYLEDGLNFYIQQLLRFYSSKDWYKQNYNSKKNKLPKKIIYYGRDVLNDALCFSSLNTVNSDYLIETIPITEEYHDIYSLLDADLVIFNRALEPWVHLINLLHKLQIPCFYFIDENYITIENKYCPSPWYTKENIMQTLHKMEGVLTSTQSLQDYYLNEGIHPNVFHYPPALDPALIQDHSKSSRNEINIAIVGGMFRRDALIEKVIPALNQFNKKQPVTLYVPKGLLSGEQNIEFPVIEFEFQNNYFQFLQLLRTMKINIIIHPEGNTINSPYKTNSILLTATYINASLIVFDESAFSKISEEEGVLKVEQDSMILIHALIKLLDPIKVDILNKKLRDYCLNNFNIEKNILILNTITKNHKKTNYLIKETRLQMFNHWLSTTLQKEEKKETLTTRAEPVSSPFFQIKHKIKHFINKDFSKIIAPPFHTMRKEAYENNNLSPKSILKVSPLLNDKSFLEYKHLSSLSSFSQVSIACDNVYGATGLLGIEIILPNNIIAVHTIYSIENIDFSRPITFNFTPIRVAPNTNILVRIFGKSMNGPVYTYELSGKSKLGRKEKLLFCTIA